MKVRTAFVSNSSSSSFAINKEDLTAEQIEKIKNHAELGEAMGIGYAKSDSWDIRETPEIIVGETWMDNFDMNYFLTEIGVPMDKVEWGECPMFGLMEEIIIPRMKEDEAFIQALEEEVEDYVQEKGRFVDVSNFLKWAKERRGMSPGGENG